MLNNAIETLQATRAERDNSKLAEAAENTAKVLLRIELDLIALTEAGETARVIEVLEEKAQAEARLKTLLDMAKKKGSN